MLDKKLSQDIVTERKVANSYEQLYHGATISLHKNEFYYTSLFVKDKPSPL